MTNDKGIVIKNIYYMLSYAFHTLRQTNYEKIAAEEFENTQDLFASILAKGISQQLKQGLYREYISKCENLSVMHGKIDINGTINNKLQRKQELSCEYDELSENNIFNQILKATATILIRQRSVSKKYRADLKKAMLFFGDVDTISIYCIKWNTLIYHGGNKSYRMLINVCYFIIEGLLFTTDKGDHKVAIFLDDQAMHSLYEKFVLEYYRYHYPELKASGTHIKWDIDDGIVEFLPTMKTDIVLRNKEKTLIIDTKYYSKTMQVHSQYNSRTIHSNNLYQIFAYIKNEDVFNTGNVEGMLLYAKTEESITPDANFSMSGNKISVKTLDLNTNFRYLGEQLDKIVESCFGEVTKRNIDYY